MKIESIDLEAQFDATRLVTSSEIFSKKTTTITKDGALIEQKKFADDSLFSKRIFGDMDSLEEYSCECGAIHGKFYKDAICPKCGTAVSFSGLTIDKYGWIDLSLSKYDENGVLTEKGNGCHIIQYIAYSQLEKIIGRDNLKNIIQAKNTITVDGDFDEELLTQIRSENDNTKYWHYGIEGLYDNYSEILKYYYDLHEQKNTELYEFLKNRSFVFTDKIPVVSIILRPAMRTSDFISYDKEPLIQRPTRLLATDRVRHRLAG